MESSIAYPRRPLLPALLVSQIHKIHTLVVTCGHCVTEIFDHNICCAVEATVIAFSAPEVVVKQRKRGMTDPTLEDAVLVSHIKQGVTDAQLEVTRTPRQKELFDKFKKLMCA